MAFHSYVRFLVRSSYDACALQPKGEWDWIRLKTRRRRYACHRSNVIVYITKLTIAKQSPPVPRSLVTKVGRYVVLAETVAASIRELVSPTPAGATGEFVRIQKPRIVKSRPDAARGSHSDVSIVRGTSLSKPSSCDEKVVPSLDKFPVHRGWRSPY